MSKVMSRLHSVVLHHSVYVDEVCYSLAVDKPWSGVKQTQTATIAVLSRHCYSETVSWYPITKRSDVEKLVRLQTSQEGKLVLYVIGDVVNGKTAVTYYHVHQLPQGFSAWCYLPETLLLCRQLAPDTMLSYHTVSGAEQVFLASALNGCVSAVKGGVIQSAAQFLLSHGLAADQLRKLGSDELAAELVLALRHIHTLPLKGLIKLKSSQQKNWAQLGQQYVFPLALVLSLYLVVGQQLAAVQAENTATALREATRSADTVLKQRQDILEMKQRYALLQSYQTEPGNLLLLWQVLSPLYNSKVTIQSLDQRGDEVVLRIQAESASATLQLLMQQPGVAGAGFDGAVRRDRGKENATIRFRFDLTGDVHAKS